MFGILVHWVQGFKEKLMHSNINHQIPNIWGLQNTKDP